MLVQQAILPLLLSTAAAVSASASSQLPLGEVSVGEKDSNPNDTEPDVSPFVFTSLQGLMRQWQNVFAPTGHTIIPGTIPAHTLLYHARRDMEAPPSPEWFAFDIEMSYGIIAPFGDCIMNTYTSTRPIKVLYFDGMSAALGGEGTLDSQNMFLYGKVVDDGWGHRTEGDEHGPGGPGSPGRPGGPLYGEYKRAKELCKWANGLGEGVVEGFVRMNSGFELLWCDFESESIELVSRLNVTVPTSEKVTEIFEFEEDFEEFDDNESEYEHHCPPPPSDDCPPPHKHEGDHHHTTSPPDHEGPPPPRGGHRRPPPRGEHPPPPDCHHGPPKGDHPPPPDCHHGPSRGEHPPPPEECHPPPPRHGKRPPKGECSPPPPPGCHHGPPRGDHPPPDHHGGHGPDRCPPPPHGPPKGNCSHPPPPGCHHPHGPPPRRDWKSIIRRFLGRFLPGHRHHGGHGHHSPCKPPHKGHRPGCHHPPHHCHPPPHHCHPPPHHCPPPYYGEPPNGSHPHHPPGQRSPFALESRWEWVRSATWHYTSPENRVKLDYCRMTSYYNVSHPSGVKRSHRLTSITPEQAEAVKTEVVHNLLNENAYCTGIDWREVADGIARRYLERIIELRELLRLRPTPETAKRARGLSHAIAMPFLQTSDKSTEVAMERCVKEYTGRIDLSRIGNSERMLVGAVEGVMQGICKLAFGVYEDFSGPIDKEIVVNARESIGELVDWVDWAGWHKCEESCGWNEVCAVPLWPILGTPWRKGADEELFARPRCVSIEFMETGNGGWGPGRPPG